MALLSHAAGLVLIAVALPFLPGSPRAAALAWGAAAGLAGAFALMMLYYGLANGLMSVVAPLSAVTSAIVPSAYGLATGDDLSGIAFLGAGFGIAAIAMISRQDTTTPLGGRAIGIALAAGIGFGVFFIFIAQTNDDDGLWPLLGARLSAVPLIVVVAAIAGRGFLPNRATRPMAATAGVLDMAANVFFLLAVRRGLITLVSVVASMYPASTLVLARTVLGERLRPVQIVGLFVAAVAVTLLTIS